LKLSRAGILCERKEKIGGNAKRYKGERERGEKGSRRK
jgi:hypothetical protein